jgi:hypothetical protein
MELRSFDSVTIAGAKGSGKSTLEHALLSAYPRVFVFDTLDEFPQYKLGKITDPNTSRYIPKTNDRKELDYVCAYIYARYNTMLLVSEAELFMPVVPVELEPNVMNIATRGRHRNVGMMLDTRRIANLNKTAFSLCEFQFIFRHWSPNDLDYLSKFLKPEYAQQLPNLADYWFFVNHQGKVELHEPLPAPKEVKDVR